MPRRTVVRVQYSNRARVWSVVAGRIGIDTFSTKESAVEAGKIYAKARQPSSLVICKMNGQIETEYTYPRSSDPRRSKG